MCVYELMNPIKIDEDFLFASSNRPILHFMHINRLVKTYVTQELKKWWSLIDFFRVVIVDVKH